ncbi:hypothetical protein GCM10020000_19410 [Streptomyces olivoverticillatus]
MTSQPLLKRLLTDPRVSKDPRRHWPAWINGEISPQWPLYTWVAVQNMFTAYGSDHRRLRTLVSKAFTARRTAALRPPASRRWSAPSSTASPPPRPVRSPTCARATPTPSRSR